MARRQRRQKIDLFLVVMILILLSILVAAVYIFITRHDDAFELKESLYDLSGECSLSLCDCQCYLTDHLPEVREGKICGNDCFGRLGIEGCRLVNDTCVREFKER
ncbi:MAG: hypothetical protein ACOC32_00895 [Nanoarchaeota archaeon]